MNPSSSILANEVPPEGALDVRYYADLLWRGWKILVAALLSGLAIGMLVAFLQTPEYSARTMLQIDPPVPVFMGVTDALVGGGNYWQNADYYNTQFQVLRSAGLGEAVVERLGLKDVPPFRDANDAGALFMKNVTVDPLPESRLVRVGVTRPDPAEASRWANTLADVYIKRSVAGGQESARNAQTWLQERLAATQQEMREAQDRLFKSYQTQDLFVPEGSQSAVTTSITRLNEEQVGAASRRIVLEAALQQIAEMQGRGQGLETVPQVASDTLYVGISGQLAALALERTRLLEKFRPGHPDVQKVEAQITELEKARGERALQIVRGMRSELAQLERRETETRGAIEGQKAQAAAQSRKGAELDALRKEAESAKNLYEVLLQKLNESNIAASMRTENVTVVERAAVPVSPVRPDRKKIAGIAALLGLLAGVGLLLGRDYVDNTLKSAEDVERYVHLDVLASVPRHGADTAPLTTEAYQNLRTALIFGRKDDGGQVVLVTGTAPQEGKSTTVVNVARLLASSGDRTLVVDCDLRRAQLHTWLGLPREPGLTDHFASHQDLDAPDPDDLDAQPVRAHRGHAAAECARPARATRHGGPARAPARRVRVGDRGFPAPGLRHRRVPARPLLRHRGLRHPAQPGGQEAREARGGEAQEGESEPSGRRLQRDRHQGGRRLLVLLPDLRGDGAVPAGGRGDRRAPGGKKTGPCGLKRPHPPERPRFAPRPIVRGASRSCLSSQAPPAPPA